MVHTIRAWIAFRNDRRAVTALEYGLIAGVLAVVVVTAFNTLGTGLNTAFSSIVSQL